MSLDGDYTLPIYSPGAAVFWLTTALHIATCVKVQYALNNNPGNNISMHVEDGNISIAAHTISLAQQQQRNLKQMRFIRIFTIMYLGFFFGFVCLGVNFLWLRNSLMGQIDDGIHFLSYFKFDIDWHDVKGFHGNILLTTVLLSSFICSIINVKDPKYALFYVTWLF